MLTNAQASRTSEAITMDFGCLYDHYVSDMTRTIYLGHASDEQAEIYNTVLRLTKL